MIPSIELALFIAFAALIAAIVRMYDTPVSKAAIVPFVQTFAACVIAAVLIAWMLDSEGSLDLSFVSFAIVAGGSVGGLAAVRALIERVAPGKAE